MSAVRHHYFSIILVLVSMIPNLVWAQNPDFIGLEESQIIEILGQPSSTMMARNRKIMIFENGARVELIEGKVVSTNHTSNIQVKEPAQPEIETQPTTQTKPPAEKEPSLESTIDTELRLLDQLDATLKGSTDDPGHSGATSQQELVDLLGSLEPGFLRFFALQLLAYLIIFIAQIWLAIKAFRTSMRWGLAVLFVPLANIKYLMQHWESSKNTFYLGLIGLGVGIVSFLVLNAS